MKWGSLVASKKVDQLETESVQPEYRCLHVIYCLCAIGGERQLPA